MISTWPEPGRPWKQVLSRVGTYLRATPTAAGPSSSKRSVLWRTRGFAALGFDCCVVVGAVSGACFVWDHMILKVCVCNILLNYASRNDFKCVRKSVKTGPQIVPKHLQNWSWRRSGGRSGATLVRRWPQDIILGDLGSTLGLHLGTSFGSFWASFFSRFFDMSSGWHFWRFGVHLGPILGAVWGTFLEACLNLYINCGMHENINI